MLLLRLLNCACLDGIVLLLSEGVVLCFMTRSVCLFLSFDETAQQQTYLRCYSLLVITPMTKTFEGPKSPLFVVKIHSAILGRPLTVLGI